MLKSKSVAKLIETTLNKNKQDESFRVVYEVGSYKGSDINCVLKQGKGTTSPIAGYTNVKTPFTLEVIVPIQCGEDRVDGIVDIVNGLIIELNGKVKDIDNGKSVFLFNPLEIGNYEARATAGQSVLIKVDFFVEYSKNAGTKYEMALINNPFDYGSVNARYFNNREDQTKWFYDRIEEGVFAEILTPNINSLVVTQQRYLNPNNVDINKLLNKNYAIIRETNSKREVKHYYYYVTNANIDQYNLLILDLSMDTLQTHYIDLEFGDCFISKAHLDRWIEHNEAMVKFNVKEDSPLFEREDFQVGEKILVNRDVLSPVQTNIEGFDNWYSNNVLGWIYLYIQSDKEYTIGGKDSESDTQKIKFKRLNYYSYTSKDGQGYSSMYNTLPCLAVPVYKRKNHIYIMSNEDNFTRIELNKSVIDAFIGENPSESTVYEGASDFIYSIKFSIVPPFKISEIGTSNWEIDSNGNLKLKADVYDYAYEQGKSAKIYAVNNLSNFYVVREGSYGEGFVHITSQHNVDINIMYDLGIETLFWKSDIIKSKRDSKYNPKLYGIDFMSMKISDNTQNGSEYDILKLGANNNVNLEYTEALTPDITKVYLRASSGGSSKGIYNNGMTQNLTGFVSSDDKSLILETNAFKTMLANNKNFFLQNSTNRGFDIGQGIFNSVVSGLQGAFLTGGNPAGAIVGAGVSLANTITGAVKSKINQNFTVDNLQNAPGSIRQASGNVVFNTMYSDTGIVVELYNILPFEKKIIDDQMYLNGFNFNKVANIKDYDNNRKYFNYIQANIEDINGEISNPIRDDIRQRFSNGVRFWNIDEIDYSKENYERWLEL